MGRTRRRWLCCLLPALLGWVSPLGGRGLDDDLERGLGRATREALRWQYGLLDDPLLTTWVDRVGQEIAGLVPRQDYPYVFDIIDTDTVNAFSAPGCFVFVTKGLLDTVRNDDQLAAVLAHELGHASERHGWLLIQREASILAAGALVRPHVSGLTFLGLRVLHLLDSLGFSRHLENRADRFACEWTYRAGYDPQGLLAFFARIKPDRRPSDFEAYLRTHPRVRDRIVDVSAYPWASRTSVAVARDVADGLAGHLRLRAALERYRAVAGLMPTNGYAQARMASIYARWGDRERAGVRLAEAQRLAADDPATRIAAEAVAALSVGGRDVMLTAWTPEESAALESAGARLRLAAAAAVQRQQTLGPDFEAFARRLGRVNAERRAARVFDTLIYGNPKSTDWQWWAAFIHARNVIITLDRALARAVATRNSVRGALSDVRRLADQVATALDPPRVPPAELEAMVVALERNLDLTAAAVDDGLAEADRALTDIDAGIQLMQLVLLDVADPLNLEPARYSLPHFGGLEIATMAARTHADRAIQRAEAAHRRTVVARLRTAALRLRVRGLGLTAGGQEVYREVLAYRFGSDSAMVGELVGRGGGLENAAWALAIAGSAKRSPLAVLAAYRRLPDWVATAEGFGADLDAIRLVLETLRYHIEDALPA